MSLSVPLPVADETDSDALRLLCAHPNDLDVQHTHATPLDLVHAYSTGLFAPDIPPHIRTLIEAIRAVQLPRAPIHIPLSNNVLSTQGMSPKKIHEVTRMAAYILSLTPAITAPPLHIVDIGAGQGYLTRALKALLPTARILALDADVAQTHAAQRWERRLLPNADPPIDHRVVYISVEELLSTLDDWVGNANGEGEGEHAPAPVLFVALHACGSLTPDILRAYIRASQRPLAHPAWYPAALIAVGCCYNLMNPSDYPKSTLHLPMSAYHLAAQIPGTWLIDSPSHSNSSPTLDPAVSLAIQKVTWRALLGKALENATPVPLSESESKATSNAPNKSATVPAYWSRRPRAPPPPSGSASSLLPTTSSASQNIPSTSTSNPSTSTSTPPTPSLPPQSTLPDQTTGIGSTPALLRLGKLPASAYSSWNTFLHHAGLKMGVIFGREWFGPSSGGEEGDSESEEKDKDKREGEKNTNTLPRTLHQLENDLAAHHVLRCLLGPVVESAILRERVGWVRRGLGIVGASGSLGEEGEGWDGRVRIGAGLDPPGRGGVGRKGSEPSASMSISLSDSGSNTNTTTPNTPTRSNTAGTVRAELVNLFDQRTGSGRNVAIVIAPGEVFEGLRI